MRGEGGKKRTSTAAVVLWLIFFFPVGFYFLYRKTTEDRTKALKNSRGLHTAGIVFFILGIFYIIMISAGIAEPGKDSSVQELLILMIMIFGGGGVLFFYSSRRLRKSGNRYQTYQALVKSGLVNDVSEIAAQVGQSKEKTVQELWDLLEEGYFGNAYLDERSGKINFPEAEAKARMMAEEVQRRSEEARRRREKQEKESAPQKHALLCKHCGASNMVSGKGGYVCEYCQMPLE